jgi:hypothetical protein
VGTSEKASRWCAEEDRREESRPNPSRHVSSSPKAYERNDEEAVGGAKEGGQNGVTAITLLL